MENPPEKRWTNPRRFPKWRWRNIWIGLGYPHFFWWRLVWISRNESLYYIYIMWVKQCHKPAPSHHHSYRWDSNHSQSPGDLWHAAAGAHHPSFTGWWLGIGATFVRRLCQFMGQGFPGQPNYRDTNEIWYDKSSINPSMACWFNIPPGKLTCSSFGNHHLL